MSTTEEIVIAAFRAVNAIDINEATCSPAEMTEGIRRLNAMVGGWGAQGMATVGHSFTGTTTNGSAEITELESTSRLAPGLNISGTGIPASTRILSIDSPTQITLDAEATADGSDVTLTVTPIPFEAKFEDAVIALLAMRLAVAPEDIPPWVVEAADMGWKALQANFMHVPTAQLDNGLLHMTGISRANQVLLGS